MEKSGIHLASIELAVSLWRHSTFIAMGPTTRFYKLIYYTSPLKGSGIIWGMIGVGVVPHCRPQNWNCPVPGNSADWIIGFDLSRCAG